MPRKNKPKPTVISTFSGCGGSSRGYVEAGFKVLLAVEWWNTAAESYRQNFPETPVYEGDIAALTAKEVFKLTGLKPRELDVFDGSPPCQGFSRAGRMKLSDPRNNLFREYVRLLKALQPKAFVMENVKGLVTGKMRLVFGDILAELKAAGYQVKAAVMNTKYYGVAQSRERVIFIGIRKDLKVEPTFPRPTSRPISFRKAVEGLDTSAEEKVEPKGKIAWSWDKIRPGQSCADVLDGSYFNSSKIHPDRPLPTIVASTFMSGYACLMHPEEKRSITIGEAKRCHGYPDEFILTGKFALKGKQIGNSVPPPLIRAVSSHVLKLIAGGKKRTPRDAQR